MPGKKDQSDFVTMLKSMSSVGEEMPASKIVTNVDQAAFLSKVVRPKNQPLFTASDEDGNFTGFNSGIDQISKTTMGRIEDNENCFRLFPDIKLAAQIVVSSISSPKDMLDSELIYKLSESIFPAEMTTEMLAVIKSQLETHYKIREELPELLHNTLFRAGATIKAILPESAVDMLINSGRRVTMESIASNDIFEYKGNDLKIVSMGILANPGPAPATGKTIFSVESALNYSKSTYNPAFCLPAPETLQEDHSGIVVKKLAEMMASTVEIIDNPNFLKTPKILQAVNDQKIAELTGSKLSNAATRFATESYKVFGDGDKISVKQMQGAIYKDAKSEYRPFIRIPERAGLTRRSVGRPLLMDIPAEAVAPVFPPGCPSDHIGYFMLTDMDGNPLTSGSVGNDPQGLMGAFQNGGTNNTMSSMLTEKARRNLASDGVVPMIERASEIYADLIERDAMERLAKGGYGRTLEMGRNNEIYRIMLARTFQSQMTRLVYIPASYVSYFAFDYHRNGVGKSYLDDLSNITSMRALSLFAKVMAKVKSSIETTVVDVTIDPRDPDPIKTIEKSRHLVAQTRQQFFPHGLNRMVDLTNWIQQAGIQMTFSGHPRLPTTKFTFETKNMQHPEPDDSLDEMFRHQTYMHFGLSPETVDSAAKADFATTIQNQSILFARRIMMLSNKLSVMLSDHGRKAIANDEVILRELQEIVEKHLGKITETLTDEEKAFAAQDPVGYKSYIVQCFLEVLQIDLPKPDSTKTKSLKESLEDQSSLIDAGLNYILNDDMLPAEFLGKSAQYVASLKAVWKGVLMRKWMAENNYAPEMFAIAETTEDGKAGYNLIEDVEGYNKSVMLNIIDYLRKLQPIIAAGDKDIENTATADGSAGSSSSGGDYGSGGGGFGEDNPGGGDGFGSNNAFDQLGGDGTGAGDGSGGSDTGSGDGTGNAFETI